MEALENSGQTIPALGNTLALSQLTTGGPEAIVVGGDDGFVYAVNACDGSLLWSVQLGAAVREIIASDWDGDGAVELVASTMDGNMVGIDELVAAFPGEVIDTDPPSGIDVDVQEIESCDTLYAAWAAVVDATDYEVSVSTVDGTEIASFASVGDVISASIAELDLVVDTRYIVGVRAVTPTGTSSVTVSDGVTIIDESPPTTSLTADATAVVPGQEVTLDYTASDATRLATVQLEIVQDGSAIARPVDVYIDGCATEGSIPWTPPGPGVYDVVLTATDAAGKVTVERIVITETTALPDGGSDAGPDVDSGSDAGADGGPGSDSAGVDDLGMNGDTVLVGGCGCSVPGQQEPAGGQFGWLGLLAMVAASRRRFRR
ncbi:MAG: PQQ-binding-like beta-propeller repeat protein [Polyangiaceae bacterium]|nr:PQQ-binding-like beta-propeller repeat protein [Polyangiaceae bacterium]